MKVYLIIGALMAAVLAWGAWQKQKASNAKLETVAVRASLSMAEVELKNAEAVNKAALDTVAKVSTEVERQRLIAAAEARKSRQRLDAFNALNRKIGNVPTTENVPVSNHLELVLDQLRSPVAGSGSGADRVDETGDTSDAGPLGPVVSPEAPTASEAPIG